MHRISLIIILIGITCSVCFGSERSAIDLFEYEQDQSLLSTWEPQVESPSAELMPHETSLGRQALLLSCDFSRKPERCYWDKKVRLDLTRFGRFSIWIWAEDPQAVRNGTIYFQSGDGWFSAWLPVEKGGWQRVYLRKSDFRIEGSPKGWDSIETIRLSFWNANNTDTSVVVDDLEAIADEIAVVFGDITIRNNAREAGSVESFCANMAKMLENSGLDFSVINDTDVESGALSGCKLAIFPYNPHISDGEFRAVEQFVKSGGKIIVSYLLPDQFSGILGIERAGWMRQESPGQFAFIDLDKNALEGLPDRIFQSSWNVTVPKPISPKTKVIGYWADAQGKRSETPAITSHANGVFLGHVLLPNDPVNKQQMLLAIFGNLVPDMRESLQKASLQNVGRMAGFESFHDMAGFIEDNAASITENRRREALEYLAKSKDLLSQAEKAGKGDQYGKMLNLVRESTDELHEAFFRSFPSREGEFRAVWCHSAFGIPGWDWDAAVKKLKESGFSAVVPNMLWGGLAYYPSEVLPVAEEVKERGDQIALCMDACRKYGLQIHVWKVNWNLSRAPKDFVERMSKAERLQRDREGNEVRWLCPSDPDNLALEIKSMVEIVRKYEVDGIHFDYIRYPGRDSCYCPKCKERFEKSRKIQVENWPEEVISGKYKEDFTDWRCEQITNLVRAVSKQAREINPDVKISAAVFRDYPRCRETVGQDWKLWIDSGYLDFICPMNYTANNDQFMNWVISQKGVIDKRIPLYPGIGASAPGLPPEQVAMQANIARKQGVSGFIIFNYDLSLAESVLPALSKGLTLLHR